MKTALVFPGQGSQTVGMGKALAEDFPVAREVFERVDEALSQKLSQLMFEGPEAGVDPHGERSAGVDGVKHRRAQGVGKRSRFPDRKGRSLCRRPFAWANIPRFARQDP